MWKINRSMNLNITISSQACVAVNKGGDSTSRHFIRMGFTPYGSTGPLVYCRTVCGGYPTSGNQLRHLLTLSLPWISVHLPVQVCLNKLVENLTVNDYRDIISENKKDAYCLLIYAFQMRILVILVAIVQTDVISLPVSATGTSCRKWNFFATYQVLFLYKKLRKKPVRHFVDVVRW